MALIVKFYDDKQKEGEIVSVGYIPVDTKARKDSRRLASSGAVAKIGIIVTNGCDSPEYSQAGKDIAKKWGLAYLDENFGYEVPLLHRVNGKPLVCAEAHQNRLENFRVSVDNTHPNDKAHEFESTFVEAWLRTL